MNIIDYNGNLIRTIADLHDSSKLVIFYPGYNYTLKAPVFFYLQELFSQEGFDILGIDYRYNENNDFLNVSDEEKDIWFRYDCSAIGRAVKDFSEEYSRIVYVGKSLGTTMLMNQVKDGLIHEKAETIYLTPGSNSEEIYLTINETRNRTLVIYGNADKYYKEAYIDYIKHRKDTYIKEVRNAGHVFEEEGNVNQSILNLAEVIDLVHDFIR